MESVPGLAVSYSTHAHSGSHLVAEPFSRTRSSSTLPGGPLGRTVRKARALRVIIGSYSAGESCATRRDGKIQERARPRRNLPASAPAGAKSNFRLRSLCPTSEEAGIPPPGGQVVLAGSSRPN